MKLSRNQKDAVMLMKKGFVLVYDVFIGRYILQIGKSGKGDGKTIVKVSKHTFNAMEARGLIYKSGYKYPERTYKLTATGKLVNHN